MIIIIRIYIYCILSSYQGSFLSGELIGAMNRVSQLDGGLMRRLKEGKHKCDNFDGQFFFKYPLLKAITSLFGGDTCFGGFNAIISRYIPMMLGAISLVLLVKSPLYKTICSVGLGVSSYPIYHIQFII